MDTDIKMSMVKVEESENTSQEIITFEQGGVFIHFCTPNDDVMLGGTLKLVEQEDKLYLKWISYETDVRQLPSEVETQCAADASNAGTGDDPPTLKNSVSVQEITSEMRLPAVDSDLNSDPDWTMVAHNPESTSDVVEVARDAIPLNDEATIPRYDFTVPLEDLAVVKKSNKGVGWKYLVLELEDKASLPPLHFHQGGSKKFLKTLKMHIDLTPSPDNPRIFTVTSRSNAAFTRSISELNVFSEESISSKILQYPVASAMIGFSKFSNFIQDVLNPQEVVPQTRPANERASMLDENSSDLSPFGPSADSAAEFEVIASANGLLPRSDPSRQEPLNEEVWNSCIDDKGQIMKVDDLKATIFKGGIDSEIRKDVWKYLLGYYSWNMTEKQLKEHRRKKEEDYYRIKMQWKSIDEEQEKRFSALRDQKSLIEKDVNRTDRKRVFYEGSGNISLKLLNDVLVTYVMYNFDLGYVQGMSDLLSPILEVMQNEVDAFWCFVGFMDLVEHNFDKNQFGMKAQLRDLRTLLQFLDPQLFDNLTEKDSNNLYFCFRWLLLRFKREFSFENIQTLWEVMWTGLPCTNYHLLMCVAILDTERETLLHSECGFTDILKHINDLSDKIDLGATLSKTEGIYNQLKSSKDIPDAVREVLGIPAG